MTMTISFVSLIFVFAANLMPVIRPFGRLHRFNYFSLRAMRRIPWFAQFAAYFNAQDSSGALPSSHLTSTTADDFSMDEHVFSMPFTQALRSAIWFFCDACHKLEVDLCLTLSFKSGKVTNHH
jgi:hypothetical protein